MVLVMMLKTVVTVAVVFVSSNHDNHARNQEIFHALVKSRHSYLRLYAQF